MGKHVWLTKPSLAKAESLLDTFGHCVKIGLTLDQAMVYAGSNLERVMQSGDWHNNDTPTKQSVERGAKQNRQPGNHRLTFLKHLPIMRSTFRVKFRRHVLAPIQHRAGLPTAPWQVLRDWLIEQGDDDAARSLVMLCDESYPLPEPVSPTVKEGKRKLPVEVRFIRRREDRPGRDPHETLVSYPDAERRKVWQHVNGTRPTPFDDRIGFLCVYNPNQRKTLYVEDSVGPTRAWCEAFRALAEARLERLGFVSRVGPLSGPNSPEVRHWHHPDHDLVEFYSHGNYDPRYRASHTRHRPYVSPDHWSRFLRVVLEEINALEP